MNPVLGTWASTVSDRFNEDGRVEWDLYGGYAGTLGEFKLEGSGPQLAARSKPAAPLPARLAMQAA